MSVYISQLPEYSGSAADLRWFIMNNSGETTTFKFSGYTSPFRYINTTFSSNNTYDTIALPGSYNKIIGGQNHTLNGNYNAVIGGYGHTFPNQYSSNNFVGGGLSHTLEGGDRHGIIGGNGNYFYGGEQNYGVGGLSNQIFIGNNSGIIGGESCSVYTGFGTKHNGIFNGYLNKINTDAKDYNTIINGSNNIISGTSYYSSIYNGDGNSIGSYSGVSMMSCFNRTANADNTTYTENHASFGQSYQGYYDNGSGSTFTINWNNGNTQKMSFTGAGGITCNNTQTGAHYRMVINNPNGYTPTSFTAAGRTIKFNGGSFVVYSGESICELFITNDSVFVNQLGLFS